MKTWIVFSIVPIACFCGQIEEEFFDFVDTGNDLLLHIVYDLDEEKNLREKNRNEVIDVQGLSLLEIDENDESLLPWSAEQFTSDLSAFMDQKKSESKEEVDDAFNYEISTRQKGYSIEPTYEKVPESKRQLFGRPKVVQAKPMDEEKVISNKNLDEKKSSNRSPANKEKVQVEKENRNITRGEHFQRSSR